MKVDIDNLTSVSKFRNETASVLTAIEKTHSPIILTKRGHPSFVLEEIDAYREKIDRLEVLEDIFASLSEIEKGETIPHDRVIANLEELNHQTEEYYRSLSPAEKEEDQQWAQMSSEQSKHIWTKE